MKSLRFMVTILVLGWCAMAGGSLYAEVADSEAGTKKILFLGDSISVGVGASSPAVRYTTLVTEQLNEAQPGKGKYVEVNVAISGSTMADQPWPAPNSSGYPYVLKKVIAEKPEVFVIQHGTNDNAVGSSLGEFLWSYREVVRTVKRELPGTTIVCMTICPSWGVSGSRRDWLNHANIGIQEIAARENTLLAHAHDKLGNRKVLFPDGIHPNDEGHRIMAESVIEALAAQEVQSKEDFDFVSDGPGQYRMCGYVFEIKADEQKPTGWVKIRNVRKNGFTYSSDYEVEVKSGFKHYEKAVKVIGTGREQPLEGLGYEYDGYRGRLSISLPVCEAGAIAIE